MTFCLRIASRKAKSTKMRTHTERQKNAKIEIITSRSFLLDKLGPSSDLRTINLENLPPFISRRLEINFSETLGRHQRKRHIVRRIYTRISRNKISYNLTLTSSKYYYGNISLYRWWPTIALYRIRNNQRFFANLLMRWFKRLNYPYERPSALGNQTFMFNGYLRGAEGQRVQDG